MEDSVYTSNKKEQLLRFVKIIVKIIPCLHRPGIEAGTYTFLINICDTSSYGITEKGQGLYFVYLTPTLAPCFHDLSLMVVTVPLL